MHEFNCAGLTVSDSPEPDSKLNDTAASHLVSTVPVEHPVPETFNVGLGALKVSGAEGV